MLTLDDIVLEKGAHDSAKDGMCALEAAAFIGPWKVVQFNQLDADAIAWMLGSLEKPDSTESLLRLSTIKVEIDKAQQALMQVGSMAAYAAALHLGHAQLSIIEAAGFLRRAE